MHGTMGAIFKLASFLKPYRKRAVLALVLLTASVFYELSLDPASG